MPDQSEAPIVRRLLAPAYWMSGSSDGHEGENEAPREAAEIIRLCEEALEEWQRIHLLLAKEGDAVGGARIIGAMKLTDAALAQIKGQNP